MRRDEVQIGDEIHHIDGVLRVVGIHDCGKYAYTISAARGWEHWLLWQLEAMKRRDKRNKEERQS